MFTLSFSLLLSSAWTPDIGINVKPKEHRPTASAHPAGSVRSHDVRVADLAKASPPWRMNVSQYTDWYIAAFPVPTARHEVVNQHACGPCEALFTSMSQVRILRRNWIIFPGLLRALVGIAADHPHFDLASRVDLQLIKCINAAEGAIPCRMSCTMQDERKQVVVVVIVVVVLLLLVIVGSSVKPRQRPIKPRTRRLKPCRSQMQLRDGKRRLPQTIHTLTWRHGSACS